MRLRNRFALATLAGLAACGEPPAPDVPTNNATAPMAEPAPTPTPPAEPPLDALDGIKVGMTLADLRARGIDARKEEEIEPGNSCNYADVPAIKDVALMLDGETVVRIDVGSPDYPTLGGVVIGMSEAEAVKRLGKRVTVESHPYSGPEGHYLVVHAADAPLGLILETDGKTVQSYRIGRWEQVQWIEGCL